MALAAEDLRKGDADRRAALASLDIDLDEPDAAPVPAPSAHETAAEEPAVRSASASVAEEPEVPVADYRGREDLWASALAILEERDEGAAPQAAAEPAYVPRHMAPSAEITAPTALPATPERAAAVAEGARATQMHTHVNDLIEEEFEKVRSASVRRKSHEYLHVIQGGTAAMPRLSAEA